VNFQKRGSEWKFVGVTGEEIINFLLGGMQKDFPLPGSSVPPRHHQQRCQKHQDIFLNNRMSRREGGGKLREGRVGQVKKSKSFLGPKETTENTEGGRAGANKSTD